MIEKDKKAKLSEIQTNIAMAKNPHIHGMVMSEEDQISLIKELEEEFKKEQAKSPEVKPIKITRDEYVERMLDYRDKCRAEIMSGKDLNEATVILATIQGNFQTICDAEANNLRVDYYKIGENFTYKIKLKKKMGF